VTSAHHVADLASGLAAATQRGELEVQFQPQVALLTGHVSGTVAMLRWHHPEHGLLWPEQFLPSAEAGGFGPTLAVGLLLAAARETATWPVPASPVWVELIASALRDEVVSRVAALARDAATLGAGSLGLHLPVAALHGDASLLSTLGEARAAGVGVAVTGVHPADVEALVTYDIDELVFPEGLVRALPEHPDLRREVAAAVVCAHQAGTRISALGVEQWPEVEALLVAGVDGAFGYLFGGPQRADRLRWVLDEDASEKAWRGTYLADRDVPADCTVPWAERPRRLATAR
jgi:EAL domain-containing protein (putative c-di-GMP-specific phosphodiesterase class I)